MNHRLKIGFVSLEDPSDVKGWSGIPFHLLKALEKTGRFDRGVLVR